MFQELLLWPSWFQIFIILLLVLLLLSLLTKKHRAKNLPPSPPRLPIIGNLHQLGKLPHRSLWKLSQKCGPVMLLNFGNTPVLIVSSPETAKQVLKTNDIDCFSRPPSFGATKMTYNLHDIAFAPYDHYWREIRKLCVAELF
ncbi:oxygenase [Lithospermum erythrorhizon]|uniref:Oxygenase n=1 Tax=Lithospermum erythrorhizon TaxID=34254 RepID=A0AAV3R197_LITER